MSLLFFSIETAFLHVFLHAISFFQSLFQFYFSCKSSILQVQSAKGVPPKEEKCHFSFFLIKRHFCMYFYVPFHFLNSFSILLPFQKQHFASLERVWVPQEEEKCHFSFSLIKRHFFVHFYAPFKFFQPSFDYVCCPKAGFCKDKVHRGTSK